LTGGGSTNRFWRQIIANVTGLNLTIYRGANLGPALGAARLAIIASTGASVAAVGRAPEAAEVTMPVAAITEAYVPRYEAFRSLYSSLKHLF
jgi:xylulokinase